MALKYDFDIEDVFGEEIFADPRLGGMLQGMGMGMSANMSGNKVVKFRHRTTVDAILAGPPSLHAMFKAAGVGMVASLRPITDGKYLAKDDNVRTHFIGKINESLNLLTDKPDVPGADYPGGFNFGDFMVQMLQAEPFDPQPKSFGSLRKSKPVPAAPTGESSWGKGPIPGGEKTHGRARPAPNASSWSAPMAEGLDGLVASVGNKKPWSPKHFLLWIGWAFFAAVGMQLLF